MSAQTKACYKLPQVKSSSPFQPYHIFTFDDMFTIRLWLKQWPQEEILKVNYHTSFLYPGLYYSHLHPLLPSHGRKIPLPQPNTPVASSFKFKSVAAAVRSKAQTACVVFYVPELTVFHYIRTLDFHRLSRGIPNNCWSIWQPGLQV